jgi:hypothetical protein
MMFSRIRLALVVVCAVAASVIPVQRAMALQGFWRGATSDDWSVATNWWVEGGGNNYVPQVGSGINIRPVIGTDDVDSPTLGALAGTAMISSDLPLAKRTIGGIALGAREFDFNTSMYINPEPAAGALTGSLTITSGMTEPLNSVSSSAAATGVDGRVLVGLEGRGYLTMTGGTLNATALVVDGENNTSGITGASGNAGLATFNRRLKVTGPDVTFSTSRTLRLNASNTYTAVITDPTDHSTLETASNAIVSGGLFVEFSGAGATHSYDQTWDLVNAAGVVSGGFNNLLPGGDVQVSGLASPPPLGAVYRTQKVDSGSDQILQLVYERVLVLNVNRTSGELSITNPLGGPISLDGYTASSALGSMVSTDYHGISGTLPTPPSPNWEILNPTANALTEVINDPLNDDTVFDMSSVSSVPLGEGFDPQAVAANVANFGTDGEDLVFNYTVAGKVIRGHVEYVGTKFENNLVLRVNPNTGVAYLKNDSQETLTFDGYSILSSTDDLDGTGWTGLGGTWEDTVPATSGALTETNLLGSTTLAPGAEAYIGDISSTGFLTDEEQDGLSMEFILSESLVSGAALGDYNNNGVVDAADYTTWRDALTAGATELTNDSTPGVVDESDFVFWRDNFGAVGGPAPELEFRPGSIFLDTSAMAPGAGGGSGSAAVPEPGTGVLMLMGLGTALLVRRGGRFVGQRSSVDATAIQWTFGQVGANIMSRHCSSCLVAAIGVLASLLLAQSAAATTGGFPLVNFDMELPGPVGTKVLAFDDAGMPNGAIPGWTFVGDGMEEYGHEGIFGDSGTEGGGNPGNEMILSTLDGVVYQVATGSSITNTLPSTQQYKLGFDAHDIFTIDAGDQQLSDSAELTARFFYGPYSAGLNTLASLVIHPVGEFDHYEVTIPFDDSILTTALGQTIGVEFDTTSIEFDANVAHSWVGIDNVVLEVTGVLAGDLNGDGAVTPADYAIVRDNQQTLSPFESDGELTGDNIVNLNDFRAFKNLYPVGAGAGAGAGSGGSSGSVPEPSSSMLALLVAAFVAGQTCIRRKSHTLGRSQLGLLVAVGLGLMLAAASPSAATVFTYDPFYLTGENGGVGEYTAGPLDGQNPNTGSFFSGPWHDRSSGDAPNGAVLATGLSYLGSEAFGGSAGTTQPRPDPDDPPDTDANTRIGRNFATPWDSTTIGTYYLSFVAHYGAMAPDNQDGDMGYRAVEFWDSGGIADLAEGSAAGYIGYNAYFYPAGPDQDPQKEPSTGRMTFQFDGNYQIIENSPDSFNQDGAPHLVVLKFELTTDPIAMGAGGDTISIYLDPVNNTEPELPGASVTGLDLDIAVMGGATIYGSNGGTDPVMDEIRVADTFADSLPPLPCAGDTNGDCVIDLDDYATIASFMNQTVTGGPAQGDVALANGKQGSDGRVTLGDYRIWRDNRNDLGSGAGAFAGQGIPEPSSLILALVAAAGLANFARRIG